jgi:hypothetical protein
MKKSYLIVLVTLTCVLGLGTGARAQDSNGVVVKVPFEFVAGGETLPAGTYTVSRLTEALPVLVIRSYKNGAFMLPMVFDGVAAEDAKLIFEHVGDKYFLSKIDTEAGAYTIPIPPAMTKVAQMKDHSTLSSSGTT